jgi:hypothetical protein
MTHASQLDGRRHTLSAVSKVACIPAFVIGIGAAAGAPPAAAQDLVSDEWRFSLTPYAWAISLDGDATVQGQKSPVDIGFDTILDDLNYGAMLEGEARKGRFGVFGHGIYADLTDSTTSSGTKIDIEVDVAWAGLGAFYRLGPWDLDSDRGTSAQLVIDPYVGVRYTYLSLELDPQGAPSADGDEDWFEPVFGFRSHWQFSPDWSFGTASDIGGFGWGSDFAWHATGVFGYRFGLFGENNARVLFGYKALSQDYDKGSGANKFEWDITLHGPVTALSIDF